MLKKLLAALLAACAVLTFAACDKEDTKTPDTKPDTAVTDPGKTDTSADETEIDYTSDLSTERYDGYNYRMLVRKGKINDQYLEEDSEDLVESATYKRNKEVEDRYGITITVSESNDSNYETDALNSILAGDDAYDLIFAHSRAAFVYAIQGAAMNYNDIKSIQINPGGRRTSPTAAISTASCMCLTAIFPRPVSAQPCVCSSTSAFSTKKALTIRTKW